MCGRAEYDIYAGPKLTIIPEMCSSERHSFFGEERASGISLNCKGLCHSCGSYIYHDWKLYQAFNKLVVVRLVPYLSVLGGLKGA